MRIDNIQSTYSFAFSAPSIDSEEKEIMQRLLAYGITPTGDKSTDRAKLRQAEEERAKQESTPSQNKYLTVSANEMEKWIAKKKEIFNMAMGATMLGEYNKSMIKQH